MEEQTFAIATADFDASLLPAGARASGTPQFREAINAFLRQAFDGFGGRVNIRVDDHRMTVTWSPDPSRKSPLDLIVAKLQHGERAEGIQLLELVRSREPDNVDVLYNLGIALSDAGRLDQAERHLRHVAELAPTFVNGLVALGVALSRQQKNDDATGVLQRAVDIEPGNPWARRNLGVALLKQGQHTGAADQLRKAVEMEPNDQPSWVALGDACRLSGQHKDAEAAYTRAIALNPHNDFAESARQGSSKLAQATFENKTSGTPRPDAVEYCKVALKEFAAMAKEEVQKITFEIAMVGRDGFDVNKPDRKYRLETMPGEFSGLQLVCYMYVGFQIIAPGTDIGFDLSREYSVARSVHGD